MAYEQLETIKPVQSDELLPQVKQQTEQEIFKQSLEATAVKLRQISEKVLNEPVVELIDDYRNETITFKDLLPRIYDRIISGVQELNEPFKIAVVGSQGSGKSTIVNLILDEDIMPATRYENEAVVIRIRFAETEDFNDTACFDLIDGNEKRMDLAQALQIIDTDRQAKANKEFLKNVKRMTIYKQIDRLKDIELINTPGMDVITEDFYPMVQPLFREADMILWVNSGEQILDRFNSWLIEKIYADNPKIVALISFPDKLYQMDYNEGILAVINQFLNDIEKHRVIRVNEQIALFVFNGLFAKIAQYQNTAAKLIRKNNNKGEEEKKLKMIYNYLHHNFAYSDNIEIVTYLKSKRLYGIDLPGDDDPSPYPFEFDLNTFYQFLIDKEFGEIKGNSTEYTDSGRQLIGEVSQYSAFAQFTDEHMITRAIGEKIVHIQERLQNSLNAGIRDSDMERMIRLRTAINEKLFQINENEQIMMKEMEKILAGITEKFLQWQESNTPFLLFEFSKKILDRIFMRIDREIGILDFFKVMLNAMVPAKFRKDSKTAVKITQIMRDVIEEQNPVIQASLTDTSIDKIEQLLLQQQNNIRINKEANEWNTENQVYIDEFLKSYLDEFRSNIQERIKIFVSDSLHEILRNTNQDPYIKLIKLLNTMFRSFIIKIIRNQAMRKILTKLNVVLLFLDLLKTGIDIHDMYLNMKREIKSEIERNKSYQKLLLDQANQVYDFVLEALSNTLHEEIIKDKPDMKPFYEESGQINMAIQTLEELRKVI
jgi:hypothetical protein